MTKGAKRTMFCILEIIETKADLVSKKYQVEKRNRMRPSKNLSSFGTKRVSGKQVNLYRWDVEHCKILFGSQLEELLGLIKDKGLLSNFKFRDDEIGGRSSYYLITLAKYFKTKLKKFRHTLVVPEMPTDPGVIQEYWWVVSRIEKERQRTPTGEPIYYSPTNLIAPGVPSNQQEEAILRKLEQFCLIKIFKKEKTPGMVDLENGVYIDILEPEEFIKYHDIISKRVAGFSSKNDNDNEYHESKYTASKHGRTIFIKDIQNNQYIISRPQYNKENETFFEHCLKHPGKITKKEVEEKNKIKIKKGLTKIVSELGFTSEIRKAFFPRTNTKSAVDFRKTINAKDIAEDKINEELFVKELEVANARYKK